MLRALMGSVIIQHASVSQPLPYVNILIMKILAIDTKNGTNASFSVQSKIFPKLKAQILQMRYQNVQEGTSFTSERKKL